MFQIIINIYYCTKGFEFIIWVYYALNLVNQVYLNIFTRFLNLVKAKPACILLVC